MKEPPDQKTLSNSDLRVIRRALRDSRNWNLSSAKGEFSSMRAVYIKAAEECQAVLTRLKPNPSRQPKPHKPKSKKS